MEEFFTRIGTVIAAFCIPVVMVVILWSLGLNVWRFAKAVFNKRKAKNI